MPSGARIRELKYFDPILTNLAQGYKNAELIGNILFPIVNVKEETGKFPVWGKDDFKVKQTNRALRAKSNLSERDYATLTAFELGEHDSEYEKDIRELAEASEDLQRIDAVTAANDLLLGIEVEQATLAQNAALYAAANKDAVGAGDYLNIATNDPIDYMLARMNDLRDLTGKMPNTIITSPKVFRHFQTHVLVKTYLTTNSGTVTIATPELLAAILGVEQFILGGALTVDEDELFEDIWTNNIIFANVQKPPTGTPTLFDPNYGLTIKKIGYPKADKYDRDNGGKVKVVRSTDIYSIEVPGQDKAFLSTTPIDPAIF